MPSKSTVPTIAYVCLSDLHLGEEDSLLTDVSTISDGTPTSASRSGNSSQLSSRAKINPLTPSPVMKSLVACLRDLIRNQKDANARPVLILNGDILEFALAKISDAAMVFRCFMQLIMPPDDPLFDHIIFIPGNHDHHIWEMGREEQYLGYVHKRTIADTLEEPYHTTPLVSPVTKGKEETLPANRFLDELITQATGGKHVETRLAYPNFAVSCDRSGRKRVIVFHHGHFIESLYRAMSAIRTILFPNRYEPKSVYELEGENFAWIDFFWSALGRSGGVGEDVEAAYERMCDPTTLEELIDSTAGQIAHKLDCPWLPGQRVEKALIKSLIKGIAAKSGGFDRHAGSDKVSDAELPLGDEATKGLKHYLRYYLRKQFETEEMPHDELVFVFGHTHKPFSHLVEIREATDQHVATYNTGGWVVENVVPDTCHGAGIALISEQGDAVNVRAFQEGSSEMPYVEEAALTNGKASEFCESIRKAITSDADDAWKSFRREAQRAINIREENLYARIHEMKSNDE